MRVVGIVLSVLLGGVAFAEPITAPEGWTNDPALAAKPEGFRFGGASTRVSVSAHRPAVRGAVLHMNRAEAEVAAERRDALATAELDELRSALRRQGADAKAENSIQRFDPVKLQLEATLAWRDATAGVVDISRIVIAADAKRIVAVTGQCVLAIDAPSEIAKACEAALATIDPEVPAASRVALAIVGDPGDAPAGSTVEPTGDRPKPPPAQLDDGSRVVLPPIRVSLDAERRTDRRPVYVGFGLIVLAALFYLNRRRREQLDREEARRERGDAPPATSPDESARDEDADDLHAAAADPDAPASDSDPPGTETGPDNGKGEQHER